MNSDKPDDLSFVDLIRRVRLGDEEAIEKLVRLYEPIIRVAVRVRLSDSGLRSLFDSMDISQSVLGNFFVRAALGQFELNSPEQIVKLLVTMARNRLTNHVVEQRTARRDHRRNQQSSSDNVEAIDPGPSPSEVVSVKELLQAFRSRLAPQEIQLMELRAQGKAWPQIAAELGGTADGLRMSLGRTLDRVARELHLQV
jgi:DNA-directed RNA polymerase specialized sigma24 family protein